RSDVSAAFAAFKHEVSTSFPEKHPQQAWGRHVQISEDTFPLQLSRLVRSATCNQRERRRAGPDRLNLFPTNFCRDKAQYSNTPRTAGSQVARFLEKLFNLRLARESEREKGQCAGARGCVGESRRVTNARHRPLYDRVAGTVANGQRPVLGQRLQPARGLNLLPAAATDRLDD